MTHVALSRGTCDSSRGSSGSPCRAAQSPHRHRAHPAGLELSVSPGPSGNAGHGFSPRKAVQKHMNKLGFCHLASMGCLFCLKFCPNSSRPCSCKVLIPTEHLMWQCQCSGLAGQDHTISCSPQCARKDSLEHFQSC